jgi:large subunit ribosomal protein L29
MRIKQLRELNKEEMKKLLDENKAKALKLRFDISSKQVKNHREYRNLKKDIARIITILNEEAR